MPKQKEIELNDEASDIDEGFEDGDYAFVFDADGNLKDVYLPDGFELDPPKVIKEILKVLGIDDINSNWLEENQSLH